MKGISVAVDAPRLAWLDTARGLAIGLVVLLHATQWLDLAGLTSPAWDTAHEMVTAVRIPLFFVVSGLLARRRLDGGWRALFTDRLALLIWVYLLWQVIGSASALVAAQITGDQLTPGRMLVSLGATVVRPRFELWFLWALVLFLVLARATRSVSLPLQFGAAAVVSAVALSDLLPEVNLGWNGVLRFYVFFLVGIHLRQSLLGLAARLTPARAGVVVLLWSSFAVAVLLTGTAGLPGVGLLLRLVGMLAGIALAVHLAWFGPLRALGSRTLPVYLAHTPVIVLLAWGLQSVHERVGDVWWLSPWAMTPLVAAVAILASIGLHRALAAGPLWWVYRQPEAMNALAARRARTRPRHVRGQVPGTARAA